MEDKRLDLDVPLLSIRRHSALPPAKPSAKYQEPAVKPSSSWRAVVPFYKSDLKSGPVRNPGVVPFVWEQKPGQPKTRAAPCNPLPPVPLLPHFSDPNAIRENQLTEDAAVTALEELLKVKEEGDNFSDPVETLSRTESFFMNCSLSGFSGIHDPILPSGSFSIDPQVKDLMMDRFLPAAQAMASGSPQYPSRKPAKIVEKVEDGEYRLRRVPLPYQHRPNFVGRYPHDEIDSSDGDDDGNNYDGSGHLASKACRLLPRLCMKSSFCLLNPMPGMKAGGRRRGLPSSASWKISSVLHDNGPLSQAENELWEVVYKHKLRLGIPHQGDGGSRSTTRQWSDSQTLNGSSSCCHSGGSREAFVEILRRDTKNGNGDGSESFDNNCDKYCTMSSSHGIPRGSGVLSPAMVSSVHAESGFLPEIPHSKHSSTDNEMDFGSPKETNRSANVVSKAIVDKNQMEENLELEKQNGSVLQTQSSGVHSLLPPPLPKTPSESWLSRTLPSVSSKIPSGQSNLGIHIMKRKQGSHSSSTSPRQGSDAKPLESQHQQLPCIVAKREIPCKPSIRHQSKITRTEPGEESDSKLSEPQNDQMLDKKHSKPPRRQIRFADVLMTPLSPRSEM